MSLPVFQARRRWWLGLPVLCVGVGLFLAACSQPAATTTPAAVPQIASAATAKPDSKWEEFHRNVQPFLAKHCYECHGDDNAENGFRLDLVRDAASLEDSGSVLEKAMKNLANHKMPPRDEPQPADAERAHAVDWLKTYLAGDPNAPINPGRVTLRRLNRAEYNNTIRDLLAINIRPADAFPVDDAGYGFDNNGDVLSLAPVLMEKYLSAAAIAVEKAIHSDPVIPPPLKRWEAATVDGTIPKNDPLAAANLSRPPAPPLVTGTVPPAGAVAPPAPATGQRRVMPMGRVFNFSGEISADYELPADGEYVLRVRAYGTPAGRDRPRVAFAVDGVQVEQPFTINEEIRNTSVYALKKTRLTAGKRRISLALLNGATAEEAAAAMQKAAAVVPKTEAELAAEEAAATAAENAAEAAALAAASANPPAAGAARPAARPPQARRPAAPAGTLTGKPTLGVIYFEIEGPLEATPDRMPESYRRVMVAQPSATVTKPQAAEKIIRTFATRAYRRPVQEEEVTQLMALWAKADSDGRPFEHSIDVALQAVLVSPAFLFRIESEPLAGEAGNVHTLNEYELATRLSYFLWSSMPDDELFALAEKGKLRANLSAQVRRMLKDPKSSSLVENFAGQWLQLRAMQNVTPDNTRFPGFDEPLRTAMTQETERFFNAIMQEDRSVLDFIDADFTYVNERLAKHYRMPGITGEEFRRVSLAGTQRGGLLTHGSILTITSYPARTSPVQRGKWVLENLFDAAPPPAPPNVPALVDETKTELVGTLRQRMEQHRSNPNCSSCHEQMDGIGFALENFDATGAWRTTDGNEKIDASGTLPGGKSFNGPVELRAIIKSQSDEFLHTLSGRMLTFALGRGLETYDRRTTDGITAGMKKNDHKFSELIEQIVRSEPFQKRNGKTKRGDS